jgi:retinol dehydrogenase-12
LAAGALMKETLRYLAGIAGPSGYGSNSTAEEVTQDCSCCLPSHLTAIVTGLSPTTTLIL